MQRIGVFVCHCGSNIGKRKSKIDFSEAVEIAETAETVGADIIRPEETEEIPETENVTVWNGLDRSEETEIAESSKTDITEKKYKVTGMMCAHCENHVKEALEAIDGIEEANASCLYDSVTVKMRGKVPEETIKEAIEKAGYKLEADSGK